MLNQTPRSHNKQVFVSSTHPCSGNRFSFRAEPDISIPTAKSLSHRGVVWAVGQSSCFPWSCSGNRQQMLLREAEHQTMSLRGENKEPEYLPDERVLQQHQPGRERAGRHWRKLCKPAGPRRQQTGCWLYWYTGTLLIRSDRFNVAKEVWNAPAAV